jgi:sigma-B regulation protein RsbU (phosphoserine phosphatase)
LVFLVVCGLSVKLRQQQISLAEQRDELQRLNDQMEAEMRSAQAIQRLLTGPLPVHPAVEIQTHLQSARILGGDTIYLTLTPDERLAIAVGDVSGKGSPAALAGAVLIGMLEESPARFRSPSETLDELNRRLVGRLPDEMFVTFFYGILDLRTGELVFSNAGHERPFLLSRTGEGEMLSSFGLPLGLFPETEYAEYRTRLRPDDLLFFYTDGLIDQRQTDGERLTAERLFEMVGETCGGSCPELVDSVLRRAVEGTGEVVDDLSMVAIRYHSTRPRLNGERPLRAAFSYADRGKG